MGETLKEKQMNLNLHRVNKFMASYSEASPAYEPEKLSETDFIPDRLARLVRQALERRRLFSLSRAADMMGVDIKINA